MQTLSGILQTAVIVGRSVRSGLQGCFHQIHAFRRITAGGTSKGIDLSAERIQTSVQDTAGGSHALNGGGSGTAHVSEGLLELTALRLDCRCGFDEFSRHAFDGGRQLFYTLDDGLSQHIGFQDIAEGERRVPGVLKGVCGIVRSVLYILKLRLHAIQVALRVVELCAKVIDRSSLPVIGVLGFQCLRAVFSKILLGLLQCAAQTIQLFFGPVIGGADHIELLFGRFDGAAEDIRFLCRTTLGRVHARHGGDGGFHLRGEVLQLCVDRRQSGLEFLFPIHANADADIICHSRHLRSSNLINSSCSSSCVSFCRAPSDLICSTAMRSSSSESGTERASSRHKPR